MEASRRLSERIYRKAKRKLLEGGRKGPYFLNVEMSTGLLLMATWKMKDVLNELDDSDKKIS